jgi:hypothetical protein
MSERAFVVVRRAFVLLAVSVLLASAIPAARAEDPVVGPRQGRYTVWFFMGFTRTKTFFHTLDLLPGNKYKVYDFGDKVIGEGTYAVDDKGNVKWLTGKYKDERYGGSFQVDGTRHQLHISDRLYARNDPAGN